MRGVPWLILLPGLCLGERINHEGRLLPDVPAVTAPVLFNTAEADTILAGMQIMPRDSAWNEDISRRPLLANSAAMIARISADLASDRRNLRLFREMNFAIIPDNQPVRPIEFFEYADESDLDGGVDPVGLYPIPPNLPIETWPAETGSLTLEEWQEDIGDEGGDRHSIMVKPHAGFIWETWLTKRIGNAWEAANGAKFSLNSNAQRPPGWTSADAAGLPMFPALVRYDEVQRGMVEHAMRIVVKRSRRAYIYPASHHASDPPTDEADVPAMGQRLRLKASYVEPANFTAQERAVVAGLKKYGAFVADNGNFFSISITPDDRYPAGCFDRMRNILVSNFEVVQTTGPNEGPRSPGAPVVNAGPDLRVAPGASVALGGSVTAPGAVTVSWKKASGPEGMSFGNAAQATTTATFPIPGSYVLLLGASDEIHTPSYDAVTVEVVLPVTVKREGSDQMIEFPGQTGRTYRVQRSADMITWVQLGSDVAGSNAMIRVVHSGALDVAGGKQFYRVVVM